MCELDKDGLAVLRLHGAFGVSEELLFPEDVKVTRHPHVCWLEEGLRDAEEDIDQT